MLLQTTPPTPPQVHLRLTMTNPPPP